MILPPSHTGFLLVSTIIGLLGITAIRKPKNGILYSVILLILMGLVIIYSRSRACAIAGIIGLFYVVCTFYTRLNSGKILLSSLPIFYLLSFILYFVRIPSAQGRILIWHVCLKMVVHNPIGYGPNGMEKQYLLNQASYFETNPISPFSIYADNVAIPYNEFIRIAVLFGLLGLFAFIFILVNVLITTRDYGKNDLLKVLLISYLAFASFSYPFSFLSTAILFLALIYYLKKQWCGKLINTLCLITLVSYSLSTAVKTYIENQIITISLSNNSESTFKGRIVQNQQLFDLFPHIADILMQCSNDNDDQYENIIENAALFSPNTDSYCKMGDILIKRGQIDDGLSYYNKAIHMVPTKINPMYRLFLAYLNQYFVKNLTIF